MTDIISLTEVQPQSSSEGMTWVPRTEWKCIDPKALHRDLTEATPPNLVLLKWAKMARTPPQSWFDDETDPFKPAE